LGRIFAVVSPETLQWGIRVRVICTDTALESTSVVTGDSHSHVKRYSN